MPLKINKRSESALVLIDCADYKGDHNHGHELGSFGVNRTMAPLMYFVLCLEGICAVRSNYK